MLLHRNHLSPPIFPYIWASAWGEDQYGLWMSLRYKNAEQTFRWIQAGTFWMGSPEGEKQRESGREDYHHVILTQGFWLADTTVTQAFWQSVTGENPSNFTGENLPVERVSWDNVQLFIQILNQLHPNLTVRLPWEAEWEYACRAGTTTPFSFGEQIDSSLVNFNGNRPYREGKKSEYRRKTTEVKTLAANDWGLYEMHGNVWEWCQDGFTEHLGHEAVEDPKQESRDFRVLRGGSWINFGGDCRSAIRSWNTPDFRHDYSGFRLALGH